MPNCQPQKFKGKESRLRRFIKATMIRDLSLQHFLSLDFLPYLTFRGSEFETLTIAQSSVESRGGDKTVPVN